MLAAFWEWYAKSGEGDLGARGEGGGVDFTAGPFVAQPHLPPFTSHLSFGHVQYRGLTLIFELRECSLAALAAVKETRPGLSQFTPVLPVALLLWCCAPAPLVSAVGSRPGSNSLNMAKSKAIFLRRHVLGNTRVGLVVKKEKRKKKRRRYLKGWWRVVDLDLGMMNTCINGRSHCTLPLYRLCKVLLIYRLCT